MPRHLNHPTPLEDPLRLLARGFTRLYSIWVSLTYPFASKGRDLSIDHTAILKRAAAPRVKIGNSVIIAKDTWMNIPTPREETGEPVIVIDDNCRIGRSSQISGKNRIHLERDVILSPSVLVMDHSHAYEDVTAPICDQGITEGGRVRIGQGSWIGYGAAIICTKGELTLGRNCVVGANSVVTRSFPAYSVVAGVPARMVKYFDPLTQIWITVGSRAEETRPRDETIPSPEPHGLELCSF
jgi:acetyltransferase-like isoleucine patch superfamily enzyme